MKDVVLACDLGGTNLRMAAIDRDGEIVHIERSSTPRGNDEKPVIDAITGLADSCVKAVASKSTIVGLGIAVPAAMHGRTSKIYKLPNLPELNGADIVSPISSRLSIPVVIDNDATLAAVGEHWLGASSSVENSVLITLGTGVGGGIIIDGRPLRGPDGTAGEIGHICVEPNGLKCGCGSIGCLEQYASASAVINAAVEARAAGKTSRFNGIDEIRSIDVYEAAKEGDKISVEIFKQMGYYLGVAISGLINVLNPEMIVLGGGAAAGWEMFIGTLNEQVKFRAFEQPAKTVKIVPAKLGEDSGVIGAAKYAFDSISENRSFREHALKA